MSIITLSKSIKKNEIDIKKIHVDFNSITGRHIIAAEREARLMGDSTPDACYSKIFQAVLAAKATKENLIVDDILDLSGSDFVRVTTEASNFLFGWVSPVVNPQEKS